MSSLGKTISGILVALVIFAGEQYIQHRFWPPNPPAHEVIPIDGRVVDVAGTRVIENAVVEISIGDIHENQNTDSDGRYAFSLEGFDPQAAASMTIDAQGYKHYSANQLLSRLEEDKEQKLEAQPAPPGHGLGATVGAVYVGHGGGQAKVPAQLKYFKRADPMMIVAHH